MSWPELREELQGMGFRFFSHGDTEVIIKAWKAWGEACVERFKGMFAFVLHERDTGRTVIARDRFGIKPLYLAESGKRLRFASTLPALLAAGDVDKTIDPDGLHHYMTFHAVVPPPRTIYKGVRKLPPATIRVYQPDGSFEDKRYWDPAYTRRAEDARLSREDWQEQLLDALRLAVEGQEDLPGQGGRKEDEGGGDDLTGTLADQQDQARLGRPQCAWQGSAARGRRPRVSAPRNAATPAACRRG